MKCMSNVVQKMKHGLNSFSLYSIIKYIALRWGDKLLNVDVSDSWLPCRGVKLSRLKYSHLNYI